MNHFHAQAAALYGNANQLQSETGSYLLLFENLLRLNRESHQAHIDQDYQLEYENLDRVSRILAVMCGVFANTKAKPEMLMRDYFTYLMDHTLQFSQFEDRTEYYANLYGLIFDQYQVWKKAAGKE